MSLKQKAIQGVKWTTVSTVITILLQLLQLVVLGRLLDSSAFGLMGMVLVIVGFADLFMDMGNIECDYSAPRHFEKGAVQSLLAERDSWPVHCCPHGAYHPLLLTYLKNPK